MQHPYRSAVARDRARRIAPGDAIAAGTLVLSRDGALPIEHLLPGDGIVTRRGVRRLLSSERHALAPRTPVIRIDASALGGRPDRALWALPGQHITLRDHPLCALSPRRDICVPLHRLVDGVGIRWSLSRAGDAVLRLNVGGVEVIYADGLELTVGTAQGAIA